MHVVVTGASSGIGEALAREYAEKGAKVSLVARRVDKLEALAAQLGGRAFPADLGLPERATDFLAAAEAAHGPVDVLINNAGSQIVARFDGVAPADGERLLALNLLTPLRLMHAVLPGMVARGRGAIVNIASLAGLVATPGMVHYSASKFGLAGASEALRGELRGSPVRVVTVYPGPVETDLQRRAMDRVAGDAAAAALPVGTPAELARRIRRAVERDAARVVYPAVYGAARWLGPLAGALTGRLGPIPRD